MKRLRVLIVEDSEDDALLLLHHLRRAGYQVTSRRVDTGEAMAAALAAQEWDVVLADYSLPQFDAPAALVLLQATGHDLPFIIISGTIGEETAVAALKSGAHDFMLKGSLARLVPAIERELRERQVRRERARAEEALRRGEERYRSLLEGIPVGVYRTAPDGTLLDANPVFREMLGLPKGDLKRRVNVLASYADPCDRERWRAALEAGGKVMGAELRVRRPDGKVLWVRDTGRAVPEPGGGIQCYDGVLEDITELRAAQDARQQSEAHFRTLIEYASDLITILSEHGTIRYQSPSILHVLGYEPAENVGQNAFGLVHSDDVGGTRGIFEQVIADPSFIGRATYRFRCKDGSWRYLDSIARNLLNEPTVRGVVMNSRDVTERVLLEEQFRQAQKMEAVGRLAGGIAHDFNNLLTVISANAGFLLEELGSADPRRHDAGEIKRAAERAASLTRQLLAFSRRQVLQPRVLDPNVVVADMDKMLRRLIGEDIELVTVLTPDVKSVLADPGQLEQVILNLTVNARDAMPEGGKLIIETRNAELDAGYVAGHEGVRPGRYVMIAVSDTGMGMTRETQLRIFEPFFTTKAQGTGLGLATVYGIVKQSEGHVAVYSEPGQGATFRVYLPVADETKDRLPFPEEPVWSTAGTETVLLVEDEPAVLAVGKRVLEEAGYTVLEAQSGPEALRVAGQQEHRPDILVTDVIMPHMGGRELADRLLARRPDLKVLYVSGYTNDAILNRGVLEPGVLILEKPFTPEAILRKVRQALGAPAPHAGERAS